MAPLTGVILSALMALAPPQIAAADTIDVVRQLYASADYESALQALDRLAESGPDAANEEGERFRALCLMALGRASDAEAVFERIIRANPAYAPDEQEAPRVRAAFAAVRLRILPDVARELYTEGKAAYDRKDYAAAVPAFEQTLTVLDAVEADERSMGDLRILTTGFLDLSRTAAKPPAPPAPEPAAPEIPPSPPLEEKPSAVSGGWTTGPEVIQQVLPPWNPAWFGAQYQSEFRGAVEVSIDENGEVVSARIVEAIHPAYDQLLLDAAVKWRYVPAQRNSKPVASTKRIDIILRPRD